MRAASLALLLLASACASSGSFDETTQAIVGGTQTSDEPAVVLVVAQMPNSKFVTLCTGSVVSPHVVLTAAHCVDPTNVGSSATFELYFGTDVMDAQPDDLFAVTSTAFDPNYNPSNFAAGSDVGVAVAKDALTQTPLPLNTTALTGKLIGLPATLLGYGEAGPDMSSTAGIKREVAATLVSYTDDLALFGMAGATACEGDSGGPAIMMIDDVPTIVGAVSFGDASCDKPVSYSRADTYMSWIDAQINAADPGFLPATTTTTKKHSGCTMEQTSSRAAPNPAGLGLLVLAFVAVALRRRSERRAQVFESTRSVATPSPMSTSRTPLNMPGMPQT